MHITTNDAKIAAAMQEDPRLQESLANTPQDRTALEHALSAKVGARVVLQERPDHSVVAKRLLIG